MAACPSLSGRLRRAQESPRRARRCPCPARWTVVRRGRGAAARRLSPGLLVARRGTGRVVPFVPPCPHVPRMAWGQDKGEGVVAQGHPRLAGAGLDDRREKPPAAAAAACRLRACPFAFVGRWSVDACGLAVHVDETEMRARCRTGRRAGGDRPRRCAGSAGRCQVAAVGAHAATAAGLNYACKSGHRRRQSSSAACMARDECGGYVICSFHASITSWQSGIQSLKAGPADF